MELEIRRKVGYGILMAARGGGAADKIDSRVTVKKH